MSSNEIQDTEAIKRQIAADSRDHRRLLLDEWRLYVQTSLGAAADMRSLGVSYAQIGLRSAILVNAGALVALPPLMQWLPTAQRMLIPSTAWYFVAGLVCAALCSLITYVNFLLLGQTYDAQANATAVQLAVTYGLRDKSVLNEKTYVKNSNTNARLNPWIMKTFIGGIAFGILSYVGFLAGTFAFVSVVNR